MVIGNIFNQETIFASIEKNIPIRSFIGRIRDIKFTVFLEFLRRRFELIQMNFFLDCIIYFFHIFYSTFFETKIFTQKKNID